MPRRLPLFVLLLTLAAMAVASGCQRNSNMLAQSTQQQNSQVAQLQQQYMAQLQDLQRRNASLDANNSDLHQQLARSEQNVRLLQQDLSLVRAQLGETTKRLAQVDGARQEAEQRVASLQSSTRVRGGATITANSSLRREIESLNIPGVNVRHDNQTVRIELPADKLFQQGTPVLVETALPVIDQVAAALKSQYPKETVSIEGHTDSDQITGAYGDNRQISTAQANAVFQQLISRHGLPAGRFQVLGRGATQPVVSNGTEQGKARNRRVEVVILLGS